MITRLYYGQLDINEVRVLADSLSPTLAAAVSSSSSELQVVTVELTEDTAQDLAEE